MNYNVQPAQIPNILGMIQKAGQIKDARANRRIQRRGQDALSALGQSYQSTGGNLSQMANAVAQLDPRMALKLRGMGQEEDRTAQVDKRQRLSRIAVVWNKLSPAEKGERAPVLRKMMRKAGVEPPGWQEKTDVDYDPEMDMFMQIVGGGAAGQQGTQPSKYITTRDPATGKMIHAQATGGQAAPVMIGGQAAEAAYAPGAKRIGDMIYDKAGNVIGRVGKTREEQRKTTETGIKQQAFGLQKDKAVREKAKNLEAHKAMKLKKSSQITEINEFRRLADSLAGNDYLGGVTGVGKLGKSIPGTPWADVNVDLERLLSMGAIASMVKMKAESPTGSTGFGALSQKELKVIQDSFAALENRNQSPTKMRQELKRISKAMGEYLGRIEKFETETESGLAPKQSPKAKITEADVDKMSESELDAFLGGR